MKTENLSQGKQILFRSSAFYCIFNNTGERILALDKAYSTNSGDFDSIRMSERGSSKSQVGDVVG